MGGRCQGKEEEEIEIKIGGNNSSKIYWKTI